jgi:hypothetical protein
MPIHLLQLSSESGERSVAVADGDGPAHRLSGIRSTYELASKALEARQSLGAIAAAHRSDEIVDIASAAADGLLLPPIEHPDPAHLYLTGTGLTHLGSAEGRDKMHRAATGEKMTDSMRMFNMGLEGGKPAAGETGAEPEWFYKGNGNGVVGTGAELKSPGFARDGSEEPELAGIYIIDADGQPWRLGFCLANEFSDHVTERGNYLWLAHSKLRPAALGAEIVTAVPDDIRGYSRVRRQGEVIWEKPFLTGEANMSHSIANLEYHHFKYRQFRLPGDVHIHFFGTATLSFADGISTEAGDEFEIGAPPFRLPLCNRLGTAAMEAVAVKRFDGSNS